jgi:hypothetical protein
MRRLLVMSIAFVSFQFVGPVCALEQFNTEAAAQQHSPTDTVVSVNIPSMIWHITRASGTTGIQSTAPTLGLLPLRSRCSPNRIRHRRPRLCGYRFEARGGE